MAQALEMKKQQERFIDMTSHEMRNPLSALLGCADEIIASLTEFASAIKKGDGPALPDVPKHLCQQLVAHLPTKCLDEALEAAHTIIYCASRPPRVFKVHILIFGSASEAYY